MDLTWCTRERWLTLWGGPLQAADGERPCFAQLYVLVHDPNLETDLVKNKRGKSYGPLKNWKKSLFSIFEGPVNFPPFNFLVNLRVLL